MNLHDWIDELCDALDLEDVEIDEGLLTDLSQTVTRQVSPAAAAVSTYLLGLAAGSRGARPPQVEELAERAEGLAKGWDRPTGPTGRGVDPPADEGGDDYAGDRDLGVGDEDDSDDLAGVG